MRVIISLLLLRLVHARVVIARVLLHPVHSPLHLLVHACLPVVVTSHILILGNTEYYVLVLCGIIT